MRLRIDRWRLCIIPEGATDEAFLGEVLGLRNKGDAVALRRTNAVGLHVWAYAETWTAKQADAAKEPPA